MDYTPPPMATYEASLPGPYVGERWATFRSPLGIKIEVKVEAWGQIATPDAMPDVVADQMWNYLPHHGRGWRYVAWRVKPYGPKPTFPTKGIVSAAEQAELKRDLAELARP